MGRPCCVLLLLLLLPLLHIQTLPVSAQPTTEPESKVYVVYLGNRPVSVPGALLASQHLAALSSVLGHSLIRAERKLLYSYNNALNGFAALLSSDQAAALAEMEEVVSVFPAANRKPATTHSMSFLGLNARDRSGIWAKSRYGKRVIIGVIDTGVWPEAASFRDQGMPAVPARWKGACEVGDSFNASTCNRKLIGGRYFLKGFEAGLGKVVGFRSARDDQGHGSHVSSIAAGQSVRKANFNGIAKGIARGGAPHAHLAMYKVCWTSSIAVDCNDADVLAALDAAVADGVDVISLSIVKTNPQPPYDQDVIAIGTFHAIQRGIFVSCAGGNAGQQGAASLSNLPPWIATVAASSTDRTFAADIALGNGIVVKGTLISSPAIANEWPLQSSPLIFGADAFSAGAESFSQTCQFLDPNKIKGKIILCSFDPNQGFPSTSSITGALGLIFVLSFDLIDVPSPSILFPATAVDQKTGDAIFAYIRTSRAASATLIRPSSRLGGAPAPLIAGFSSRGPNSLTPDILKPDLTAPGVQILAAWSPFVNFQADYDVDETSNFNIQSGTSMSCPHVAGVAALLRSLHPSWSPAAIKSALMTTAYSAGIRDAATNNLATPFDYGAGHISPIKAANPGLVYDAGPADYVAFLCGLGFTSAAIRAVTGTVSACPLTRLQPADLNYPSVAISNLAGSRTVSRTLTNVGPAAAVYTATVSPPPGVSVQVVPAQLHFTSVGQRLGFKLIFTARPGPGYVFGRLTWSDGVHSVSSPLAVSGGSQ